MKIVNTIQIKNAKKMIIFDKIADMLNNKKLLLIPRIIIRSRKLNIFVYHASYFVLLKNIRLYFIMKIAYKRELQLITINHSSDIDFKDILSFSFFGIDTTLTSDNPFPF